MQFLTRPAAQENDCSQTLALKDRPRWAVYISDNCSHLSVISGPLHRQTGKAGPGGGASALLGGLHQLVLHLDHARDGLLAGLLQLPRQHHFVQHEVRLVEIKDEVKLANIPEVSIEHLHEVVDDLQCDELIVPAINAAHEVQTCVPLVYHLLVLPVKEVAQLQSAAQHHRRDLPDDACALLLGQRHVPFRQPHLALPRQQQKPPHRHCRQSFLRVWLLTSSVAK
mmetsp:Transcript_13785/g.41621  ORF Transcript_13785/g.41621 Transcript_13785/m.41621 type:complete len:225 (+) Transcript_13785:280-954(+)